MHSCDTKALDWLTAGIRLCAVHTGCKPINDAGLTLTTGRHPKFPKDRLRWDKGTVVLNESEGSIRQAFTGMAFMAIIGQNSFYPIGPRSDAIRRGIPLRTSDDSPMHGHNLETKVLATKDKRVS